MLGWLRGVFAKWFGGSSHEPEVWHFQIKGDRKEIGALNDALERAAAAGSVPDGAMRAVQVALDGAPDTELPVVALIDAIEAALGTAVQGAVKRVDEQEFARLNGINPLYCEDAVRRIRSALEALAWVSDYRIETAHLESLHPHDAVACVVKGVSGGFVA